MEKRYSHIERETIGILCRLKKSHHYCFVREVEYNNRSQTTSCNIQKRCSYRITETTMNQNHIQAWTRSIHHRLALLTKLHGKQRNKNTWHAVKYLCHTNNNTPECMTIHKLQQATSQNEHLQHLKDHTETKHSKPF